MKTETGKSVRGVYLPYNWSNTDENWADAWFPDGRSQYFSYARGALVSCLQHFDIGEGDNVGVPFFICADVLAAIHAVGARPVFYHVDEQLDPIDLQSMPSTRAIMAVNYFGFPQKLARFDAYCQQHGAILIEDNAHGLFSRDTDNARLGHRGDAGIFSIRKTIPLPSGAAVVYRDCHESGKAMPVHFSTVDVHYLVKLVLRVLMYAGGPRIVGLGLSAIRGMRLAIRGEAIPASDPEGRYKMPSPATGSPLMKKIFEFIDEKQETQRRRHLYRRVGEIMAAETECRPVFPSLPAAVSPYAYPFYCEDLPFRTVERKLLDKGLLCITWPNLPEEAPAATHDHYRQLRLVLFLW
jgi:hypothetical protein